MRVVTSCIRETFKLLAFLVMAFVAMAIDLSFPLQHPGALFIDDLHDISEPFLFFNTHDCFLIDIPLLHFEQNIEVNTFLI